MTTINTTEELQQALDAKETTIVSQNEAICNLLDTQHSAYRPKWHWYLCGVLFLISLAETSGAMIDFFYDKSDFYKMITPTCFAIVFGISFIRMYNFYKKSAYFIKDRETYNDKKAYHIEYNS